MMLDYVSYQVMVRELNLLRREFSNVMENLMVDPQNFKLENRQVPKKQYTRPAVVAARTKMTKSAFDGTSCYNCNAENHWARDCPYEPRRAKKAKIDKSQTSCYNCGEPGHWANECQAPRRRLRYQKEREERMSARHQEDDSDIKKSGKSHSKTWRRTIPRCEQNIRTGSTKYDIRILTITLLLSNVFVYNHLSEIDSSFISRLRIMNQLAQQFETGWTSSPPLFLVTLRDFELDLKDENEEEIDADQYMAMQVEALERELSSSEIKIRFDTMLNLFPRRKCFTFESPAEGEKLLNLDNLQDADLLPEFLKQSDDFCCFVISNVEKDWNQKVTGKEFCNLLEKFMTELEAKEQNVADLDTSLNQLAEKEERDTILGATNKYRSWMFKFTDFRMGKEELHEIHILCINHILKTLKDRAGYSCQVRLKKQLEDQLKDEFSSILKISEHKETPELSKLLQGATDYKSGLSKNMYANYMRKVLAVIKCRTIYEGRLAHCEQYRSKLEEHLRQQTAVVEPIADAVDVRCAQLDTSETVLSQSQNTRQIDVPFLDVSRARAYIQEKGNKSPEVEMLLQWFCKHVENALINQQGVCVTPGYHVDKPSEPVLLAMTNNKPEDVPIEFNSFPLFFRKVGDVSEEGKAIAAMEVEEKLQFTSEEHFSVQECLRRNTKPLMSKHSNLEIVSASKIKSRKYGREDAELKREACIVLYVHVKGIVPFHEEPFPEDIEGFPVDVREGRFEPYVYPPGYVEKLEMGCQIASASGASGTLGGFVELDNGSIGCLSCWHVFKSASSYDAVYQPNNSGDRLKFGFVQKKVFDQGDENSIGVDAAVIQITDPSRRPVSGVISNATSLDAGFSFENPMVFDTGKIINSFTEVPKSGHAVKYGATTGHTVGMLRLEGSAVHRRRYTYSIGDGTDEEYELFHQFEIFGINNQPFSDHGDSGSLVFIVSHYTETYDIRALGMLVGGTTNNTTMVTPIWAVLDRLGLPKKFLTFRDRENSAATQTGSDHVQSAIESDVCLLKGEVSELKILSSSMDEKLGSVRTQMEEVKDIMDRKLENVKDDVKQSVDSKLKNVQDDMKSNINSLQDTILQAMQKKQKKETMIF